MTNLKAIIGYLSEGTGGNWPPERIAVWTDQLHRTGYATPVLMEAARRFVASARFPVVADFLAIAREIQIDSVQRIQAEGLLAIPEGVVTWEEKRQRLGLPEGTTLVQWLASEASDADERSPRVVKVAKEVAPPKDISAERERQKRALRERDAGA